eukprot:9283868-Alexandrium_andersonii.AAC.1
MSSRFEMFELYDKSAVADAMMPCRAPCANATSPKSPWMAAQVPYGAGRQGCGTSPTRSRTHTACAARPLHA